MKLKNNNMNLQEHIRRILREDKYSPAGKEIIPNKIVIHKSNPKFRDIISNEGLKVRAGECYKIYAGYGEKCIPAIFATNSINKKASFDSTYDDDVWEIDTEMIPDVKWYKDKHYESRSKHIVTFENIPADAITLKHEGTGKDWGLMESTNNDKLSKETMIGTFQDIVNQTLDEIRNICEVLDIDTFPGWLSFDGCDVVDTIDKITIVNIERKKGISRIPMFEVDVNLVLNGIWGGIDYDDFMYSIADRIIGKWKIRLIFNIKEQENSNKREMWESDEHKNNIRNPFKLSDPSTRIEEDRVQIRLGRNMYNHFGKIQNIIIMVDDQDITSEDGVVDLGQMNIVINDGEIYVGDIVIPEKYRGQGIATIVYQKISDYFGLPIVNSKTKGRNQLDQGGQIWKNREKFEPRNMQESIRRILREETEVIPSFIMRRIGGYVNNILLSYGNHNLQGNFKNLIDEISDVIINDLLSDYIDSIGYTVDDEDDNYDQSVVDKVYDTYYNVLAEHIQGNYSDEIYKLYRKNK